MNSQINIEGLSFAHIEETHMATTTSFADRWVEISTMPIENEEQHEAARKAILEITSDQQSYLATLDKDFPRGSLGLHGRAFDFAEGSKAAAS